MNERRLFVRIPAQLQIFYKIITDKKEKGFIVKDITSGGLRFYSHKFISKGEIIEIKIRIGKPFYLFKAMVKVIWVAADPQNNRYEVGAKFESISRDSLEKLTSYLDSING